MQQGTCTCCSSFDATASRVRWHAEGGVVGVHLGGKAGGLQARDSQSLALMRGLASPPEPDCVPMLLC